MAETPPSHLRGLKVAVTGASGNVGTALLRRLTAPEHGVAEVRGLARRRPPSVAPYDSVQWHLADLGQSTSETLLSSFVEGVDAVVHLAWALQPGRDPERLERVNVEGTRRVVHAATDAGVQHVVHMSSLGTYAPGAPGRKVTEDWPATGVPSSQYSRQKAAAERIVREVLARHPGTTLTIARPTLVLQPEASSEIARYFLGPLLFGAARAVPAALARLLPLPAPGIELALVHADDVADALTRMLDRRVPGPFNLAAEPLLDAAGLARALRSRRVPVPRRLVRTGLSAAFHAHLVPTEPGWLDLGIDSPALDSTRARTLLGWEPAHRGDEVLAQFVAALGRGEGAPGPLLAPAGGRTHDPADSPANVPD
ncbi:NAD-dependent epimerase/dehydratase family protein [Geodermatophilus sp. YIM 151500]|uniref:NAD-dependent epimerase/dehydratase family protein n=1 Tax=Geodermatophilus sp. YIM 151500 TaxID=2984531 RepID=UPI0021E3F9C8|nr:NAD-dependent epimerase/dehydratase family protein [Geodermatophilus sp. YIM 151500]MCV2491547.1 NAD-dependent epimerase/dehydratase family protein [Geodermatophilus sp. YIM 151500]